MKKLLLFLLPALFITSQQVHAQAADVTWGDETAYNSKSLYTRVISEDNQSLYALRSLPTAYQNGSIFIDKISKSGLESEHSFEIYNPTMYGSDGPRPLAFDEVIMVNDGFLAFFTEFNLDKKTFTSFCQKFDKDGNKKGDFKQLQVFQGNDKTVIGKYIVIRSPLDDGFFLLYSRPFILYSSEYLVFDFFDYNLEKKWEKRQVFPYAGKEIEPRQYKTNPMDSTLYLMVRVLDDTEADRIKKNNRNVQYSFGLLSFKFDPNDTSTTFKQIPFSVPKKFITDVSFEVKNGEILLSGYYADKKDMAVGGAYYMVLEERSGKQRSSNTYDFEKDFLAKFVDPPTEARGSGVRDFEIKDLQVMNDGSVYLLSEITFQGYSAPKGSGENMTFDISYYYNDLVVVKISNEQKILWAAHVPKRTMDDKEGLVLSYTYAIYKDKVVFIYNDLPKNLTVTNPLDIKYVKGSGGVQTVIAEVNSKGEVHREVLFQGKDAKIIVRPKTSIVDEKDKIYMYAINGNKQRWGLFKFY